MNRTNSKYPTLLQIINVFPYTQFVVTELLYIDNEYFSFRTAWRTTTDGELTSESPERDRIIDLPVVRMTQVSPVCWYVDVRKDVYNENTDEA